MSQIISGTAAAPCTPVQFSNGTCETLAAWAAVDAAKDSAKAANASVDLGIAGLVVGAFTLLAAFYAAWQAKRGADAAVHDARANADAALALAKDRELQLGAQARLHGAKIRLTAPRLRLDKTGNGYLRWNLSNSGDIAARIHSIEIALEGELDSKKAWIIKQRDFDLNRSATILPEEEAPLDIIFQFDLTNTGIVGSDAWFLTRFYVWIQWDDDFRMNRFEKWIAIGSNIVGTLEQHASFQLEWSELSTN